MNTAPDCAETNAVKTGPGPAEIVASLVGGGVLASLGIAESIARRVAMGVGTVLARGAILLHDVNPSASPGMRTATNGVSTTELPAASRIDHTLTIPEESSEDVSAFWGNLENLPKLIDGLESVKLLDDGTVRFVVTASNGGRVEWDSEVIHHRKAHAIEWNSAPDSQADISGMLRFKRKRGHGTKVHLTIQAATPGDVVSETVMSYLTVRPESPTEALVVHSGEAELS
jgi:uncharacterized membrane protein